MQESESYIVRDNAWLAERLNIIRSVHFSNVPDGYPIEIRFGVRARYRFGSIAARNGKTIILINQLFRDPIVPTYVVDSTIAHEMAHYAHGFGSGLPRKYADPHRGGVVDRELELRGLTAVTQRSDEWRKLNWESVYARKCSDLQTRREERSDLTHRIWQNHLSAPGCRTEELLRERLHAILHKYAVKPGSPVFAVEWLEATLKQCGTSYWFDRSCTLKLHGLLADRRVPDVVIDFELAYWVTRHAVGSSWPVINRTLARAGFEKTTTEALNWRRTRWTAFRNRYHPLNAKR